MTSYYAIGLQGSKNFTADRIMPGSCRPANPVCLCLGLAWHGMVWPGMARRGRHGEAGHGVAGLGVAGQARHG